MDFIGAAKKLDDIDLPRVGEIIGVGEDEIHAFLDVETRGGGFDSKGRPKMLFEPHIFWRELTGAQRDQAASQGLAYKKWKRNYPKDSYPRLKKAMAINEDAALRSASWGLGQVMGFNCKLAGYETAKDMVLDFLDDEEKHLEAAVQFIISAGLDDELRRRDWAGFADGYNGPGFAANQYDVKLRKAFEKWQRIKDTDYESGVDLEEFYFVPPKSIPLLESLGLDRTEEAIRGFQRHADLDVDGKIGPNTMRALQEAVAEATLPSFLVDDAPPEIATSPAPIRAQRHQPRPEPAPETEERLTPLQSTTIWAQIKQWVVTATPVGWGVWNALQEQDPITRAVILAALGLVSLYIIHLGRHIISERMKHWAQGIR